VCHGPYHLTGVNSYYGRKAKCRGLQEFFLHFFYKSLLTTEVWDPVVESKDGVDSLVPAYETLCRKRRKSWVGEWAFRSRRLLSGAMNYKTTNACVRRRCWPVVARLTCSRNSSRWFYLPFSDGRDSSRKPPLKRSYPTAKA